MPVRVIPAVVGALGTAPKKLKQWLSDRDWGNNCGIVQNYCLIFCKDTLKCSWSLRGLNDTEPHEI